MGDTVRYGTITFDRDFLGGLAPDGTPIRFTRAERRLLAKFAGRVGIVLSRDQLLDAVSGQGSDAVDRSIDFLINRLRRKLGDSARQPTFIETRYGEGYVWIAERQATPPSSTGAFLVVGPLRGLNHAGPLAARARAFAADLRQVLGSRLAHGSRVVVDEDCPPPENFVCDRPTFGVELSFLVIDGRLECAVTLKGFATGQIIRVLRQTVSEVEAMARAPAQAAAARAGEELLGAIWEALAYRARVPATPTDEPLAVRMHHAALMLADTASWLEAERRLRATLAEDPKDAVSQLMLATALHSKYVLSGAIWPKRDHRAADEAEMERLAAASLPHVQDNPIFMLAAGKLLYFLDRGHRPLAIEIVEEAFESTTAFATSFAVVGQIRMFRGDTAAALALFDQGLELAGTGSPFETFLLVLKCQALLAAGRRQRLDAVLETLYASGPGVRHELAIYFTSPVPGEVDPVAEAVLEELDAPRAQAKLVYTNYVCARLFEAPEHRRAILAPSLDLFVRRFGQGVVPEEVGASLGNGDRCSGRAAEPRRAAGPTPARRCASARWS